MYIILRDNKTMAWTGSLMVAYLVFNGLKELYTTLQIVDVASGNVVEFWRG